MSLPFLYPASFSRAKCPAPAFPHLALHATPRALAAIVRIAQLARRADSSHAMLTSGIESREGKEGGYFVLALVRL